MGFPWFPQTCNLLVELLSNVQYMSQVKFVCRSWGGRRYKRKIPNPLWAVKATRCSWVSVKATSDFPALQAKVLSAPPSKMEDQLIGKKNNSLLFGFSHHVDELAIFHLFFFLKPPNWLEIVWGCVLCARRNPVSKICCANALSKGYLQWPPDAKQTVQIFDLPHYVDGVSESFIELYFQWHAKHHKTILMAAGLPIYRSSQLFNNHDQSTVKNCFQSIYSITIRPPRCALKVGIPNKKAFPSGERKALRRPPPRRPTTLQSRRRGGPRVLSPGIVLWLTKTNMCGLCTLILSDYDENKCVIDDWWYWWLVACNVGTTIVIFFFLGGVRFAIVNFRSQLSPQIKKTNQNHSTTIKRIKKKEKKQCEPKKLFIIVRINLYVFIIAIEGPARGYPLRTCFLHVF